MFEQIIASNEIKFNELEKKVFKFVCFFGCLIIKLLLESNDRKLMDNRDKKKYRHKGLRGTTVNTVMGEVKYKRVMYEICEDGVTKTVYLLDEVLNISVEGKVSSNLVEKVIETVPVTDSYRKSEKVIEETTNTTLSHEKIRNIVVKIGEKITNKEKGIITGEYGAEKDVVCLVWTNFKEKYFKGFHLESLKIFIFCKQMHLSLLC